MMRRPRRGLGGGRRVEVGVGSFGGGGLLGDGYMVS